jgi:hypothetical protein
MMEKINRKDASLYVDIHCTACGKVMPLSMAVQHKNQYLCERHAPTFDHLFVAPAQTERNETS